MTQPPDVGSKDAATWDPETVAPGIDPDGGATSPASNGATHESASIDAIAEPLREAAGGPAPASAPPRRREPPIDTAPGRVSRTRGIVLVGLTLAGSVLAGLSAAYVIADRTDTTDANAQEPTPTPTAEATPTPVPTATATATATPEPAEPTPTPTRPAGEVPPSASNDTGVYVPPVQYEPEPPPPTATPTEAPAETPTIAASPTATPTTGTVEPTPPPATPTPPPATGTAPPSPEATADADAGAGAGTSQTAEAG